LGETREIRKVFFENVPVKPVTDEDWYTKKVALIQTNKAKGLPTLTIETEIDERLFDLYELSESDKAMIRSKPDV